jgi:hypothetical protein
LSYIRLEIAEKSAQTDTQGEILSFPLAQFCGAVRDLEKLSFGWTKFREQVNGTTTLEE